MLLQTIEAMPKLFFNAKRVEILPLAEDPEFFLKKNPKLTKSITGKNDSVTRVNEICYVLLAS